MVAWLMRGNEGIQRAAGATCRHLGLVGHHGQKRSNVLRSQVAGMAHATTLRSAPADEKSDPVQVGFFGLEAIVHVPNSLAHLIEQADRLQQGSTAFHGKIYTCLYIQYIDHKASKQEGFAAFWKKMYRQAPDVSTGFCGLNYVKAFLQISARICT
jgi:hypothetical protein